MGIGVDGGIITPEAVPLELRAAGLASRIMAKSIDLWIQFTAFSFGLFGFGALGVAESSSTSMIALYLWIFAVFLVVPIAMEQLFRGRSVGKVVFGLRVVTMDGGPTTFRHALGRGLLQPIEIYTGLAVFPGLVTRPTRRFGDLVAGTFVLSERVDSSSSIPTAFLPPEGYEPYVAALDVGRLSDEHYVLIRSMLLRVSQLSTDARWSLTSRLAGSIQPMVTPAPHVNIAPEIFLVCVASAFQRRSAALAGRRP